MRLGVSIKIQTHLLKKFLFFLLLILCQFFCVVNLSLFFSLDFFGVGAQVGVEGHLVPDGLAVVVNLLVEELEQPRREELEVLHDRLLRRTRR